MVTTAEYLLEGVQDHHCIHLQSADGMNRLTRVKVEALTGLLARLATEIPTKPIVLCGNARFFSAGADLQEIRALQAADAFAFASAGQRLMQAVDRYPAPVVAAIEGYCMGGGLDLALACDLRIAAATAIFGHRGASLGIMTGWGGTQRLPRLIGKARSLQMFLLAQTLTARQALMFGLISAIADDPRQHAIELLRAVRSTVYVENHANPADVAADGGGSGGRAEGECSSGGDREARMGADLE